MQEADGGSEDESADRPQQKPSLARIGPDRTQCDAGSSAGSHGFHVAHEVTIAGAGVGSGEAEASEAGVNRAAPRAGEDVDARTGGFEKQRVGEPGGARLDLVALHALGL